ncbi:hypothetical protein SAMN05216559_3639 [Halomicrobium zhouii]|uniref:Uncharacterized protein n=1 Tax=Halomicrobium zhouii TaxID=767519 RepID=A0A1I6M2U8_9EURY|nr:hypothetical protein [Halomicrobium zhouii]SFS10006.1 hypothetical protein SAMN05216559_3639 [Halomicrobium zhouii]
MTGLKSGSGDDLWGDDGDEDDEADDAPATATGDSETDDSSTGAGTDRTSEQQSETPDRTDTGSSVESDRDADSESSAASTSSPSATAGSSTEPSDSSAGDAGPALDASSVDVGSSSGGQPYIVRRAIQDKSVQFERDERLTFFVHDDVADGERDLITDLETALGRDLPKFDVREAVYRAALRNPEAVLEELLAMGYSADEE